MNPEQPQQNANPTPSQPTPVQPAAPASTTYPGKGLGIASFVVSLVGISLIGLILGIVALRQSKKAGRGNGFAVAGIVLGAIGIVFAVIFSVLAVSGINAVKDNTTCMTMQNADGTTTQHCTLKGSDAQSTVTQ